MYKYSCVGGWRWRRWVWWKLIDVWFLGMFSCSVMVSSIVKSSRVADTAYKAMMTEGYLYGLWTVLFYNTAEPLKGYATLIPSFMSENRSEIHVLKLSPAFCITTFTSCDHKVCVGCIWWYYRCVKWVYICCCVSAVMWQVSYFTVHVNIFVPVTYILLSREL